MNNECPKVSVVIPAYNAEKYISETLQCIFSQSYQDYEIIVVDDCSTDRTKEIIHSFSSHRLKYFCLERNHGGPSRGRNRGIAEARGEYIALCDSDDLVTPDRLRVAVDFLDNNQGAAMVFTDEEKFDDASGKTLGRFLEHYSGFRSLPKQRVGESSYVIPSKEAYTGLFYENYIMPSGVTLRRSVIDTVGDFDESLTNGDDRDLWFRISKNYSIGFLDMVSFRYRKREGSISSRGNVLNENRIKVLQKQREKGLPEELHKQCNRLISKNYFSIGYFHQRNVDLADARKAYLLSISHAFNVQALKGFILCLLGKRGYLALSKSKKLLKS